jgi:CBS-domain-containing membrane protein
VVDEQGKPVGFLTDRDVCMAAYTQNKPLTELPVEGAMARTPVCCRVEDDLDSAAQLMREHRTRRVPVVDGNGILVGLLTLDDLACEAARPLRGGRNNKLVISCLKCSCRSIADVYASSRLCKEKDLPV